MAGKTTDRVSQRLQPKLRVVCNGGPAVNHSRAAMSGAVAATGSQKKGDVRASLFVELETDRLGAASIELPAGARDTGRRGRLLTVEAPIDEVDRIAADPGVAYVSLGDRLDAPTPRVDSRPGATPEGLRRVDSKLAEQGGESVLIGIIDVGGFDFAHPAFVSRDGLMTRFHAIWDQGGDSNETPGLYHPYDYQYGVEITADRMEAALAYAKRVRRDSQRRVNATDLVPQSSQVPASHGTHVASIAAGRYGVAPNATLAGVSIALSEDDRDRRSTLFDSSRLAHAVNWLIWQAQDLDLPLVINVSLGSNGHAHDGSSPVSRWIDSALNVPGRCVVVAAGNAGQERASSPGDLGWLSGRIHASGRIAASGLEANLEWRVGGGVHDASENEMEIWYEPQDRFEVLLRPPGSDTWIGPVPPSRFHRNLELPDGSFVSIFNERYHPSNGANRISLYLSPRLKGGFRPVPPGTWTVRLRGLEVRDGRYHAWIERDDPRRIGRTATGEAWSFPSFFTERSNVDESSVSSLACGHRVVSVANYDEASERVAASSSQGPTRDGRFKPEIAAPGSGVVGARGFASDRDPWVAMSGTSMAAPHVAGVAALMLGIEPRLTATQIIGMMRRTSQPLPGADYTWQNDAGFGRIQPELCLEEAAQAFEEEDLEPTPPRKRTKTRSKKP